MTREITTHKVNGLNAVLAIEALDEPGHGNACHKYLISAEGAMCSIVFQDGPIKETGVRVNGISNESLLAVVLDRLEGFQSGQYACETNQQALDHVAFAMAALNSRTRERLKRGVEGTHAK